MPVQLHNLKYNKKSRKRRKVIGRGNASGHGTTSCRGGKGQRARTGSRKGLRIKGFKRILLNLPKFKGMKPRAKAQVVTLSQLNKEFSSGGVVNPQVLMEAGLIKSSQKAVKLLNSGEISVKIEVQGCLASAGAVAAIEKAGGQVKKLESTPKSKEKKTKTASKK